MNLETITFGSSMLVHVLRAGGIMFACLVASACTVIDGPEVTTTSPSDHVDAVCEPLSKGIDAGATGDRSAYGARMTEAVAAAEGFKDEYPGSDDAHMLLEFSLVMRDLAPGGADVSQQAEIRALFNRVTTICGSE